MAKKRLSGTREWAQKSYNCIKGCLHGCLYCYARKKYVDNGGLISQWAMERPIVGADGTNLQSEDCTVMFPTEHDISPENLDYCIRAMKGLLKNNDRLLIVTKPHYDCIHRICGEFAEHKDRILFRFTIGSFTSETLAFWEPGAPDFDERFRSLIHAFKAGYATSVSCEPLLEPWNVGKMVYCFREFVTDSIWIGKMNRIDDRVLEQTWEIEDKIARIEEWQTDKKVREIYEQLKSDLKIRWKESYAQVLGLPLSEIPG